MRISFTKMHGNGNDFVLIDNMGRGLDLGPEHIRRIARRRFGVGCDQVLVAEPAHDSQTAVAMRIYNTDGSRAGHCGNGLRSFAVYAHRRGLVSGEIFKVEIPGGTVTTRLLPDGQVHTTMGVPSMSPADIPLNVPRRELHYDIEAAGERLSFCAVSIGNPHAVLRVEDVDSAEVERLGPAVQALDVFAEGVNVGFMQIVDRARIRLRVYERGVGETLACGSGACAAVVVGNALGALDQRVQVELPGGPVLVQWPGPGTQLELIGPATHVYDGEIEL